MALNPQFIWYVVKKLLYKYKWIFDPFGLVDKAAWALYQFLILSFSVFCAVCIYFTLYNLFIPTMYQSTNLYLYKTDTGYYSRVFQTTGDFPICEDSFPATSSAATSEHAILRQKTCANPVDLGVSQINFGYETYEITVKLALPKNAQTIPYGERVPVSAEFISVNNQILNVNTEGIPTYEKLSLTRIVKGVTNRLGLTSSDLLVDVNISEKFSNTYFGINVINIEVRQPHVVVRSGIIEANVVLTGIRYYMYHWFWTTSVLLIATLALWIFISINVFWRILSTGKKAAQLAKDSNMEKLD